METLPGPCDLLTCHMTLTCLVSHPADWELASKTKKSTNRFTKKVICLCDQVTPVVTWAGQRAAGALQLLAAACRAYLHHPDEAITANQPAPARGEQFLFWLFLDISSALSSPAPEEY